MGSGQELQNVPVSLASRCMSIKMEARAVLVSNEKRGRRRKEGRKDKGRNGGIRKRGKMRAKMGQNEGNTRE